MRSADRGDRDNRFPSTHFEMRWLVAAQSKTLLLEGFVHIRLPEIKEVVRKRLTPSEIRTRTIRIPPEAISEFPRNFTLRFGNVDKLKYIDSYGRLFKGVGKSTKAGRSIVIRKISENLFELRVLSD